MMSRACLPLLALASLTVAGCSTISDTVDKINPFASSAPKMSVLPPITPSVEVREQWSVGVGKAGDYTFQPAVVGRAVYVAARDGTLSKVVEGRTEWSIKAGQPLSAGVGSDSRLVVVGTAKGDVLAFSAEDGRRLWQSKATSEILAPPAVGAEEVVVKSGDNRVVLLDASDGKMRAFMERREPVFKGR